MDNFPDNAKYTIDMSSLKNLFSPGLKSYYKGIFTGLWDDIERSMSEGLIVSHDNVLREIKNGDPDDLRSWATSNANFFYQNITEEADVLNLIAREVSQEFVSNSETPEYADPWLVAQAKTKSLILITEEKFGAGRQPQNFRIPDVCARPQINVQTVKLYDLIAKEEWKY